MDAPAAGHHVFADGGYAGDKLREAIKGYGDWTIEIIKRSDTAKGFEVLIGKGRGSAARLLKARIVLRADIGAGREGWDDARISEALETGESTVYRVRHRFMEEGLEATLIRKKHETLRTARIFDGEVARLS